MSGLGSCNLKNVDKRFLTLCWGELELLGKLLEYSPVL